MRTYGFESPNLAKWETNAPLIRPSSLTTQVVISATHHDHPHLTPTAASKSMPPPQTPPQDHVRLAFVPCQWQLTPRCSELLGDFRSYSEMLSNCLMLFGDAIPGVLGVCQDCSGLLRTAHSCSELRGAGRSWSELVRASRSCSLVFGAWHWGRLCTCRGGCPDQAGSLAVCNCIMPLCWGPG